MTNEQYVGGLLVVGYLVLPTLIGLWARAWRRRPLVWAVVTMLATPFLFLPVVFVLMLKGRSPRDT